MSTEIRGALIVLTCKKGAGKFADYPDIEVLERVQAVLGPLNAVVGVATGGDVATIRVASDNADDVLAAVAPIPGVLSAELKSDG